MEDIDRYREIAERMRAMGLRANTTDEAESYAYLAECWDKLADEVAARSFSTGLSALQGPLLSLRRDSH